MQDWSDKLDAFLSFNERDVLSHAGKVSHQVAEKLAHECYGQFDMHRRDAERLAADIEDVQTLEDVAKRLENKKRPGKKERPA